ncbi:GNAT superfamily N-acetyltransferase [Arthrobacter sp. V4I6]|uniref:GNAT family N-acetyltransferase n=1 Tax=unclassified Arthrobacter TaxID=235627 RepID=UPI0027817CB2|nr:MULTISPECIES: GNAT family N-acetyltransferase [unclassified Arthrobacter]MDQ0819556.1 GNAT superfamily N-acetyltransferase [Arthrobacter sp. V1I7]MDQ0853737.1 GNAT superfamily N-acetyltransferase [Arthrobacter sp. V4I6]
MTAPETAQKSVVGPVSVRPLRGADLDRADEILRAAFGTYLGVPDPFGTIDYIRTRFAADPHAAFAATVDGELVGSNFAVNWGSVGYFGPLTVRPDLWDHGVGKSLMEPIMGCFETWGNSHLGLFTYSHSPKHLELYRRYGFWPRFLTAVMQKQVGARGAVPDRVTYAELSAAERPGYLSSCRALTDAVYEGLDLEREIVAAHAQGLGDTVLLPGESGLDGLAVCHCGPGSEAGTGVCFVKFGAVRPGRQAGDRFERLLDACEQLAAERGLGQLEAGMNLGRPDAYQRMVARGFRTGFQGVTMHRPNEPGYSHPDAYVIDDWR